MKDVLITTRLISTLVSQRPQPTVCVSAGRRAIDWTCCKVRNYATASTTPSSGSGGGANLISANARKDQIAPRPPPSTRASRDNGWDIPKQFKLPTEKPANGFKFAPPKNISPRAHYYHTRYEPLLEQMTKQIMRDGKLSKAQRHMAMVLNILQTSTPPKESSRALIPDAPPMNELPLDPLKYLQVAIDSVAPIIKVVGLKGIAGGGATLDIPVPLTKRQRRRAAIKWILDIAAKKESPLSGRERFAQRLAHEIIAVVQGTSNAWNLRQSVHKVGTTARANLNSPALRSKGMVTRAF